ncbi:MAG: two-component sensor histidine kinase, partial [Deltaproteobacteria bacterium]
QACGENGQIDVYARRYEGQVEIRICDDGCGLPVELAGQIFEPLVTTKQDGTGLGLAIVKQLVEELNGEVDLTDRPEGGVEAKLVFPEGDSKCAGKF